MHHLTVLGAQQALGGKCTATNLHTYPYVILTYGSGQQFTQGSKDGRNSGEMLRLVIDKVLDSLKGKKAVYPCKKQEEEKKERKRKGERKECTRCRCKIVHKTWSHSVQGHTK